MCRRDELIKLCQSEPEKVADLILKFSLIFAFLLRPYVIDLAELIKPTGREQVAVS